MPALSLVAFLIFWLCPGPEVLAAELQPHTLAAWETYVRLTEQRIGKELEDGRKFLAIDFLADPDSRSARSLLRAGSLYVLDMKKGGKAYKEVPVKDGMIHHWIGAVFVPKVKLDALLEWLHDYDHHEQYFPEVEKSKLLARNGDQFQIFYRLRRKKIITVYYNTNHTAFYQKNGLGRAWGRSFTTRIAELDNPGTPAEKEKPVGNDSGFLWRLNSYWRYEEADGGVVVECESLSLSRSIPLGLGWLIRGYVESTARESLENTLTSIRDGIGQAARRDPD